jgi:hypothetical protein
MNDFFGTALLVILMANGAALGWVGWKLSDLLAYARQTQTDVSTVRLKLSTRVSRVSMQSGAVSDEQQLQRLGRASVGRRIVVGGDDDSQLNRDLTTSLIREADDE